MMRYLAILKDSLREARDSWVLLGLLAAATLVIVFVASLSFTPVSAERTMQMFFGKRPGEVPPIFAAMNNRKPEKMMILMFGGRREVHLEKVTTVRGEADSPLSDYDLTVSLQALHFGGPVEAAAPMDKVDQNGKGDKVGKVEPTPEQKKAMEQQRVEARQRAAIQRQGDLAYLKLLFEDAEELGYIKLGGIEPIDKAEDDKAGRRYRISVQGTPTTYRIWATETALLFGLISLPPWILGDAPLGFRIYGVAKFFVSFGSWIAIILGIVVTAFFVPNMLRKGTIDMLLVKPISRWSLLAYKYLGGLTFIFLISLYAMGGIWFALGIRSGLWATGTLLLIFTLTFFFAILYSISVLVGVVTRSVIMSILVTVTAYGALALLGFVHNIADQFDKAIQQAPKMREMRAKEKVQGGDPFPEDDIPGWVATSITIVKIIYAISPRTDDLNSINDLIVYTDFMTGNLGDIRKLDTSERNWWVGLLVAGIWIALFLGLASLWFYFKDY